MGNNIKNFEQYSSDNKVEETITPTTEETPTQIDESMGGYIAGLFNDLRSSVEGLDKSSNKIKDDHKKELLDGVKELENKFKKVLKGKGISHW